MYYLSCLCWSESCEFFKQDNGVFVNCLIKLPKVLKWFGTLTFVILIKKVIFSKLLSHNKCSQVLNIFTIKYAYFLIGTQFFQESLLVAMKRVQDMYVKVKYSGLFIVFNFFTPIYISHFEGGKYMIQI